MSEELDLYKNTTIASFGKKTLEKNLQLVDNAIADLAEDFRIHNHSNSQFQWQRFVLNHKGGIRNLRQITAEINKKHMALSEAKFNHKRKQLELISLKEQLKQAQGITVQFIETNIQEIEEQTEMSLPAIEGAIKDILTLKQSYNELIKEYEGYSEKDFEQEEVGYWIRRLFSQSLNDIRAIGTIAAGNQQSIEQMGFNVSFIIRELINYIEEVEEKSKDSTGKVLNDFLEESVEKYSKQTINFVGYGNFSGLIADEALY